MDVVVMRLGHRYVRDDRATTHLFLTARVFGANKVVYLGQRDERLEKRLEKITKTWGGSFIVAYEKDFKQTIDKWKAQDGEIIHLTIYGLPIMDVIHDIQKSSKKKMIIVGGAKVPRIVYKLSDWNVSITSQPHSEISALSIFLHELFQGKELDKIFKDAKLIVIPQAYGKKVKKL